MIAHKVRPKGRPQLEERHRKASRKAGKRGLVIQFEAVNEPGETWRFYVGDFKGDEVARYRPATGAVTIKGEQFHAAHAGEAIAIVAGWADETRKPTRAEGARRDGEGRGAKGKAEKKPPSGLGPRHHQAIRTADAAGLYILIDRPGDPVNEVWSIFEKLRTGARLLRYWPASGTWIGASSRGQAGSDQEALWEAANLAAASRRRAG